MTVSAPGAIVAATTTAPVTEATARRLTGRRAVVVGGARGIGAEVARRLHTEGACVQVLDRLVEQGEAVAAEVGGGFTPVDLLDPTATQVAVEAAVTQLGGVDIAVNSAGILRLSPLLDLDLAEWAQVQQVNTVGTLTTMRVAARAMIAAGTGGAVVNIASMAAKHGGANEGAYAASKAAVVALTRVAALEWGCHGIRVNALCPGYVLTEMGVDTRTEDDVARWSARSPLGRLGQPADVAAVVALLASDDGSYLTGQAINVTGGMIMH